MTENNSYRGLVEIIETAIYQADAAAERKGRVILSKKNIAIGYLCVALLSALISGLTTLLTLYFLKDFS